MPYTPPVPQPASVVPMAEAGTPVIGTDVMRYALEDHRHPRITSSVPLTLDANGQGVSMFTRTFTTEPLPSLVRMPGTPAGPCIFEVESWVMSGPDYVGANIRGYRLSGPSNLASVTVLGISVIAAPATITTYGPANGVKVSVIMLPNSGV